MLALLKRIFDSGEKELARGKAIVGVINALEPEIKALPDEGLRAKTVELKERLSNGADLDSILPEAFALVREASVRTIGLRHFDVQLLGGIVLHKRKIAEMKTGEGKTLVATLPAFLNALTGRGVHVVTVNDYLARRDCEWMRPVFEMLGMSMGVIQHDIDGEQRRAAYNADITYGTNNEFGFDYLRDNMVADPAEMVQRELNYAIVDEVDSILIDEARTPLIISGISDKPTELYYKVDRVIAGLHAQKDYEIHEKERTVTLTEDGIARVENLLGIDNLSDSENIEINHHVEQALKARYIFKKDVDYVIKDGRVIIVDEFTGRLMFGRRYSDGLHQAIEAKENVKIEHESQTLATITFQNYFRLYDKLAGMTGTAKTEENEFVKIYGLEVVIVPTNMPMVRDDHADVIYKTENSKFRAVVEEIIAAHDRGQPVLVGTRSIEKSERVSDMLKRRGVEHQVLNAKHHEREAEIIAQAGRPNAVTIATNMAGRGVDILLGGNPVNAETADRVRDAGGLYVIGTERHESRRIDNQLRGRSGRQGDPGASKFFVSLEDELMRLFGGERISGIMERLGLEEDQPIEHPWISKAMENAQRKVEEHNFSIRKHVLQYDDVMNEQRRIIYEERRKALQGADLHANIIDYIGMLIEREVDLYTPQSIPMEEWDISALYESLRSIFPLEGGIGVGNLKGKLRDEIVEEVTTVALFAYNRREEELGLELLRELERMVILRVIDSKWIDHLYNMDELREGISLRAYGQIDPLIAYQREAFDMFDGMKIGIMEDTVRYVYRVQVVTEQKSMYRPVTYGGSDEPSRPSTVYNEAGKVGRNDPCPCGSGKKYKRCCGA